MAENKLGSLAKQTAIYGLSSIVGRFLNYLLVPLYTYKIAAESGGYGIVTNLYAYSALLLVILTFGMETTFFRFSNKERVNPDKAFSTSGLAVGFVALVFVMLISIFLHPISNALHYAAHPEFVERHAQFLRLFGEGSPEFCVLVQIITKSSVLAVRRFDDPSEHELPGAGDVIVER